MPQIVPFIATVLIKIGASKLLALAIANFVVTLAATAAIAAVSGALMPKPRGMNQGEVLRTKIDPAYPREVAVGRFATGGSLVFENVSGDKNRYLWRVFAISDAEIEQITQVRGHGEALTFDGDIHTGLRKCTSHFVGDDGPSDNCLWLRVYKGTSTQTADGDLTGAFPSLLDSNFRGRGVAYAIARMEASNTAWASGVPDLIFVGEGAAAYDPRDASTAYTGNLALIARQFLKGYQNNSIRVVGLGVADDDLPDLDYEAAGDECDETVDGESRYHGGGMINARETPREILAHLCAAMGGAHIDRGGEIVILPGVARTAVLDIAEEDLLADVGVVYSGRRTADERVNAINSTYVNPDDGWQEAALPPRKDAAAITADGDRFDTTRAYRFCLSSKHGQRLDKITLTRARKEGFFAFGAPLWAFELTPGDWFTSTNPRWGNVQKTFEVETVQLAIAGGMSGGQPQARCLISARETGADCYAWDAGSDLIAPAASGTLTFPAPLDQFVNDDDRIITVDALPIGGLGGTGLTRTDDSPLAAPSSSQIDIAAHDMEFVGKTYELPSGSITGLSTDTNYLVVFDIAADDYDYTDDDAIARGFYTDPDNYLIIGMQRTQDGGGPLP